MRPQATTTLTDTDDHRIAQFLDHIRLTRDLTTQAPEHWAHRNYYDLVLTLSAGVKRVPLELPYGWEPMEVGECYRNAWEMALDFPDQVTYVEGYAQASFLPTSHAWLETPDGTVIDPTWSNPEVTRYSSEAIYCGVRFSTGLLRQTTIQTEYASVFGGDYLTDDHEALRKGFVMDDHDIAIARKELA